MIIEVKRWPESQEVMENSDWFFIMAPRTDSESNPIGDSAYGRVLDESDYIVVKCNIGKPTNTDNNFLYEHDKINENTELKEDLKE